MSLPGICTAVFILCFLAGALAANLRFTDETMWIGFLSENEWMRFADSSGNIREFLLFAVRNRLIPWALLVLLGCFPWGRIYGAAWSGWIGASGGILFAAMILRHGAKGILFMGALCLPQAVLYVCAVLLQLYLIRFFVRERNRRGIGMYIVCSLLFSAVFAAGVFAEYYINPLVLEWIG